MALTPGTGNLVIPEDGLAGPTTTVLVSKRDLELDTHTPSDFLTPNDSPTQALLTDIWLKWLQILFGSVLGNMARYSMTKLTDYDNSYVHFAPGTCLWSNFTACFIMAWCNNSFEMWNSIMSGTGRRGMKQVPLHSGITGGFCGSYSTWSSLIVEVVFKSLDTINGGHDLPHKGDRVMEFFSVLIVQMGVSFLGYYMGRDFALVTDKGLGQWKWVNSKNCLVLEVVTSILGVCALITNLVVGCVLSPDNFWKNTYALSILFGAVGTFIRIKLSNLNGRFRTTWFPIGTFLANYIACTVLGILYMLLYGKKNSSTTLVSGTVHRFVLTAFSSGFCGSLSTTSSFVNELYGLKETYQRYVYFVVTFAVCFATMFLIDAPYVWTVGFVND